MTRKIKKSIPPMPAPRPGMVIEPVTTYEELPIVTEAARAELLASLEKGAEDAKAGRVKRVSVAEFKSELRADFERITGRRPRSRRDRTYSDRDALTTTAVSDP